MKMKIVSLLVSLALVSGCATVAHRSTGWTHSDPLVFQRADLATAGLGIDGLRGPPPAIADPLHPTAEELRRLAVYNNYRSLVDVSDAGGFGRLYGPRPADLPIAGAEYWALGTSNATGSSHVMILQVPQTFDPAHACLIAAPSSGSRGPYGAIGTTGDWALRRGCAVVYTDKGTGPWIGGTGHSYAIDGRPVTGAGAGAPLEPFSTRDFGDLAGDIAFKHAHSGHNPEADWGRFVLDSIRFAVDQLDAHHPRPGGYHPADLLVIAASVSNGGGAVLRAAEADSDGLIDAVVASEPNIHVHLEQPLAVLEGDAESRALTGRPLYDYATWAALYEPCATLDAAYGKAPLAGAQFPIMALLSGRCEALAARGLIEGSDTPSQAASARQRLLEHGVHPDAADAAAANTVINVWAIVAAVYANAYGGFAPGERVCDVALHPFNAAHQPTVIDPAQAATVFGTSAGVPPAAGVDVAHRRADGSYTKLALAVDEKTGQPAYGLEPLGCLRDLLDASSEAGQRVRAGIAATAATADLGGRPAIIVHGRSDALVWINHTSRSYYAANQARHGADSQLRYIEVTNAQHFDTFLGLPGFDARFIPLHVYFEQALDAMWTHLTEGSPLPPSQLVVTTPRGNGAPPLAPGHVPPINHGNDAETIQWQTDTLIIPR